MRKRGKEDAMCEKGTKDCCKKNVAVKAGDCPPEKIRECHGEGQGHPCASRKRSAES